MQINGPDVKSSISIKGGSSSYGGINQQFICQENIIYVLFWELRVYFTLFSVL